MPVRRSIQFARPVALGVVIAVAAFSTPVAEAQQAQRPTLPRVTRDPEPQRAMTLIAAAVLVAAGLGAATIPSKRGHQD